ncbi:MULTISPECIES: sodium:solute symporter family protein [unclassified Archaeoglobus]|jgi:SSS family solute:Na+ symporter|uniref:sodium:solute symporter family protein n=1 Tax=unclassified Archaeoglobus TaxID=2643606 RepID=UPI0025C46532|nr:MULTISPECIES: cation acetate symporter [unclassified Archaeoglobus]
MVTVEAPVVGITVLYFLAIVAIGYYSRQRLKSATDYYVAGRQVGAVVNGLALESTYLSPASMLGLPAYIFILGYPFWWAMSAIIAGMPIATLLTASALRKYAPTSFADYYADRYNDQRLRWLVGIVTVIGAVLYITLSIVGMALFLLAIAKVPYIVGVIVGTIIVMLYVVWGGMIATSWNAAFQAFLMTLAAVIAAVAILIKLGGISGFYEAVAANNPKFWNTPSDPEVPHLLSGTWIAVIGWFFVWHYGFATMPYTVVRFFTTMDIKTARRSIFWCTLAAGIFYMALQIIGAGSKLLIETGPMGGEGANAVSILKNYMAQYGVGGWPDYSMVAAVEALQNPWILGILCAGGLAIAMSTAAGWVMVVNTLVTRDWGDMMLKSRYAKENPITLARIISVIFLLVGLAIAVNPPGLVLDLSGWAFVVIISALGPGLILGLWWKRATRAAMWTTAIIMTPLHLYAWLKAKLVLGHHAFFFLNDVLFGDKTALITPHQVWAIPVGFILFIIVSLITKPVEKEAVEKYCIELTKEV